MQFNLLYSNSDTTQNKMNVSLSFIPSLILQWRLFFALTVKYGDVVNRSISLVVTSSNSLKGQLQKESMNGVKIKITQVRTLYAFYESLISSAHVAVVFTMNLYGHTAAILIYIVSKAIMRCSGGKLVCLCPLSTQ